MDSWSILQSRIDSLLRELGQAEAVLDRTPPDPVYGKYLQDRAQLEKEIRALRNKLQNVREPLGRKEKSLAACWSDYSQTRLQCNPLFGECLAFALGPLMRGADLDAGLCRVADVLLEKLSHKTFLQWTSRTILAESEFIGDLAQIVRLRFPVTSAWDLPVAAHEFGHFVMLGLEREEPLKGLVAQSEAKDSRARAWLAEHFADTFATHALGPAFACTCLLLRLDPAGAMGLGSWSHPSDAMRAYAILRVLEKMDQVEGAAAEFGGVIRRLEDRWQECAQSCGRTSAGGEAPAKPRLDDWLDVLYPLIKDKYPQAKYEGWSRAKGIAKELRRPSPSPAAAGLRPGDGDAIADVLNAAWFCQLEPGEYPLSFGELGDRALAWCRHLVHA